MIITSISKQKHNNSKYNVYIDYNYSFSADIEDIIKLKLNENDCLSNESLSNIIFQCQYKKAFDKAIKLLSVRQRSKMEIRQRLLNNDFNEEIIDKVIIKLEDYNYINDNEFCNIWIKDKINLKPVGKRKIIEELKLKGINKEIIDNVLNSLGYDELSIATRIIQNKISRSNYNLNDITSYQKIYRFLISKGIGYEIAKKALYMCLGKDSSYDE